ncbi:MAG: AraC family transcriptional regulator [Opitutaceae bacterium]|nr:AraC family transcriptional regulator [Opitutaceae bacterium]
MTRNRDYRDPFTGVGVRLSGDSAAATDFLIHEAGCLRYRDWNHCGIVSPYWRLHHNFTTGNSVVCDRSVFPLRPDVAVLTPAGVRIDTCGPRVLLHTWIHFTPTRGYRLPQRAPFSVRLPPPLRALLRELAAAFRSRRPRSHAGRLHHLGQALLHGVFAGLDPGMYRSVPADLGALLARMEKHPEEDLTVLGLARMAGRSRSRFAAWFKAAVDETPAHYVQRLRIRLAATRLGFGEESVEEVAAATGFANRHHFTRVFSAMTGIGPGAYRKRHKQP